MLSKEQIKARELTIEALDKMIVKCNPKIEKEKAKRKSASVMYKGVEYTSARDLSDAYAYDVFSSDTYDILLDKLYTARGKVDSNEMTPTEMLVYELRAIKNEFVAEIAYYRREEERKERTDKRMKELIEQGYSYREAETIVGNEQLMEQA